MDRFFQNSIAAHKCFHHYLHTHHVDLKKSFDRISEELTKNHHKLVCFPQALIQQYYFCPRLLTFRHKSPQSLVTITAKYKLPFLSTGLQIKHDGRFIVSIYFPSKVKRLKQFAVREVINKLLFSSRESKVTPWQQSK